MWMGASKFSLKHTARTCWPTHQSPRQWWMSETTPSLQGAKGAAKVPLHSLQTVQPLMKGHQGHRALSGYLMTPNWGPRVRGLQLSLSSPEVVARAKGSMWRWWGPVLFQAWQPAWPGHLLETQILQLQPNPWVRDATGGASNLCVHKPSRWRWCSWNLRTSVLMLLTIWTTMVIQQK